MHARSIATVLAPACLLIGACSTLSGAPPRLTSIDVLAAEDPAYKTALDDFYRTADDAERRKVRNQFVETRIAVIDHEYLKFRQSLYQGRIGTEVGTDLALLSLNGLGAAVSSAGAKTTYAALSALLVGGKTSIDKNVYFERTVSALLSQMDTLRNNKKVDLFNGLTQPIENYPLSYAKAETDEYYLAGTIARAIQGVNADSAVASQVSETNLRDKIKKDLKERGIPILPAKPTDVGELLGNCYLAESKENQGKINAVLSDLKYQRTLGEFITDKDTESKRPQLLNRLQAQGLCQEKR